MTDRITAAYESLFVEGKTVDVRKKYKDRRLANKGHKPQEKNDDDDTNVDRNPFKDKNTNGPSNIPRHSVRSGRGGKRVPEKTRRVSKRNHWNCNKKDGGGNKGVSVYRCVGKGPKKGESRDIRVNNAYRIAHNRARRKTEKAEKTKR